jgi:hypothetical protein
VNLMPPSAPKLSEAPSGGESKEQQIKAAMKALDQKKSVAATEPQGKVEAPGDRPGASGSSQPNDSVDDDKVTVQLDRKMLAAARQMMLNRKKKQGGENPKRSDTRA